MLYAQRLLASALVIFILFLSNAYPQSVEIADFNLAQFDFHLLTHLTKLETITKARL